MSHKQLIFNTVTFSYEGGTQPVIRDMSFSLGPGWTSIAGANGCGKSTLLKLACAVLSPDSGLVQASGRALYCPQRTDSPPEGFTDFVREWAFPELMARMGIEWDWPDRWETLSHGERKRAQLALALSGDPDVLAVDEPVNHLDTDARNMVADALERFSGAGLLVSHDRRLMDRLSVRCGILQAGSISMRKGGYTVARREDIREQNILREKREMARKKFHQMKRDARRKQLTARTLQARSCGREVSYRDICMTGVDGPSRIDSSVQKAGQLSRTATARMERAREEMESITFRKEWNRGISLPGESSHRDILMELPAGIIPMGSGRLLHPGLELGSDDRIALTGPNGSGKSTLIRKMLSSNSMTEDRLVYIPQELTAEESASALGSARELKSDTLGHLMSCVRRLGSDPAALLKSRLPSPGETRKLLLCLGLLNSPWLVIMDEPTNHLDLPGIECLESALRDLQCALLLVSHDELFLRATTDIEWSIERHGDRNELKVL